MRLTSYEIGGKACYGLVTDENKLTTAQGDLSARYLDIKTVIAANALDEVGKRLAAQSPDTNMDSVTLLPVIPNPGKIFCIGLNYKAHRDEGGWDDTEHPSIFIRFPESQTGHNRPMMIPIESDKFDFEGEMVAIIGKGGRRISEADALKHIAAYSCYN